MKKVIVISTIVALLMLSFTGCIEFEEERYTFLGYIEDFEAADNNTFLSRMTDILITLDTNQTIYTSLRSSIACKIRKGLPVYEDEYGTPQILIKGYYYC